jgi:hypothetical protein
MHEVKIDCIAAPRKTASTSGGKLGIEPPKLLRGEVQDDGEDPDQVRPHLFMFQELEDDVPEILYLHQRSQRISSETYLPPS